MKLTIGKKLGLGFGIVLMLTLISALLTSLQIRKATGVQDSVLDVRVPSIERSRKLQSDLNQSASKARQVVLAASQSERMAQAIALFDAAWVEINKDLDDLEVLSEHWSSREDREHLGQVKQQVQQLKQVFDDAFKVASGKGPEAITKGGDHISDIGIPVNDAIKASLGGLVESQIAALKLERSDIAHEDATAFWTQVISSLLALAVGVCVAAILGRGISGAARGVLGQAEAIARGDLTHEDSVSTSQDEMGELTVAINKMHGNLKTMIEAIGENAQQVANSSEEFTAVSQQISSNSEETTAQVNVVSNATELVNQNLQTVATGAEEMSSTIQEIAKNATEAARVAGEAVKTAEATNATVSKLGDSSHEIGEVIKVITSIAQQTNLLALNATIEAARAGEAGKGFAVVANEVKELAKQTARATEDISRRIEAIQTDAKGAVEAIRTISEVINKVNDISGTIASAVEEQSVTTNEMSRNVVEASRGAGEIAQNIAGVAQAAQSTSASAHESLKAADQLAHMSIRLRGLIEKFRVTDNPSNGRDARRVA